MSSENAAVDWDSLLEDWNSVKKIKFPTSKEMLAYAYLTEKTYKKTGKVFLLSAQTIGKYMRLWEIECFPKGHRGDSPCLRAIKALGDVSGLTSAQITEKVRFSRVRVTNLMATHSITYKKLRE